MNGVAAPRALHVIVLVDCSGSMRYRGKIQALNIAVREAIPHLRQLERDLGDTTVLMRVVRFSTGAEWHVKEPTPIARFEWRDVEAGGFTDLGVALALVARALEGTDAADDAPRPVLLLITDGRPTDDFDAGLHELVATPAGARAIRTAIAIGDDVDHEVLQQFVSDPDAAPLRASSPEELVRQVRTASTGAMRRAHSRTGGVPIPEANDGDRVDVW